MATRATRIYSLARFIGAPYGAALFHPAQYFTRRWDAVSTHAIPKLFGLIVPPAYNDFQGKQPQYRNDLFWPKQIMSPAAPSTKKLLSGANFCWGLNVIAPKKVAHATPR